MTTTETRNTRSAAIYVRISKDRTGEGLGVDRQEGDCRAMAERLGWTVTETYTDNDLSAFSGRRRKRYEELLSDIEAGRINAVICWHPDRLHRSPKELERYIDLCESRGIENQAVTAGHWDLSTASGRMNARNMGNYARFESEHKSERIKAARVQHAKQGKQNGGRRPYGYTGGVHAKDEKGDPVPQSIVEEEAAEIRKMCDAVTGGVSLRAIVRDMNTRGVPTTSGKIGGWTSQHLREMLRSPRIAGHSTHRGRIVGGAQWPAIVDEATWRAVEEILRDPKRRTNPGVDGSPRWLGSGTYICGACGERRMRVSVTGGSKRHNYRCANPDRSIRHVTRDAVELDKHVERAIVGRLARPGTVEKLLHRDDSTDLTALRIELSALGARKDELAILFADGQIDGGSFATAAKRLDERADKIAAILAKAGWRSPLEPLANGDIHKAWARLSVMQKRAILNVACDVTVLPAASTAHGFDPDAVRFDWKVG